MNCPHCGAALDNGAKFCKFCGESLADAQPVYTPPMPDPQPIPQPAPSYVSNVVINNEIPPQYKPLSAWKYFGLSILYAIPVIGFIFLLVYTFSDKNINRRNHARSYWCALLIGVVISVILVIVMLALGISIDDLYY